MDAVSSSPLHCPDVNISSAEFSHASLRLNTTWLAHKPLSGLALSSRHKYGMAWCQRLSKSHRRLNHNETLTPRYYYLPRIYHTLYIYLYPLPAPLSFTCTPILYPLPVHLSCTLPSHPKASLWA